MAKTTIKPGGNQPAEETTTLATQAPAALAERPPEYYDSDARDTLTPRLILIQPQSKLARKFKAGSLLFDDTIELKAPLSIIALAKRKYYVEDLPQGSERKPKIFGTANDAHHAGFAIDYSKTEPFVRETADVILLIKAPAGDQSGAFLDQIGNDFYALAITTLRKGSYRNVYRRLNTDDQRRTRAGGKGMHELQYELTVEELENDKGAWFELNAAPRGLLAPEVLEQVVQNYGSMIGSLTPPKAEAQPEVE